MLFIFWFKRECKLDSVGGGWGTLVEFVGLRWVLLWIRYLFVLVNIEGVFTSVCCLYFYLTFFLFFRGGKSMVVKWFLFESRIDLLRI